MKINRMQIIMILIVGFFFPALPIQTPVHAESLWAEGRQASSLYSDRKAAAVGDILTIVINENSSASRSGNASNSKTSSTSMSAGVGLFTFLNDASAGNSDSFQAKGSITNTNKVTGKITVQVVEVQPNGNLVISGTQKIKQNGEEQSITISGIVRPDDIAADNTVSSNLVANAQLYVDGKGPIAGKQRQGIITQLFNILF
ncbi:flagellar basal body L-ring protein FlgH [Propionispora vibrioides]|uniref:Flagellar L-ring protein n=1 Tax=Propionispora vibrioides TaxID=112903 RepID=A0A1H8PRC0_9FIRM|nr:flagellar basal body L-ring protein FlgH [Propionispora vibrioides]SEO44562.1 flagellar L-ring protein precursor FlgH [Propionispora vibrioides]